MIQEKKIVLKKNDKILERLLPGHETFSLSLSARKNDVMEFSSAVVKFHVCSVENNTPKEISS